MTNHILRTVPHYFDAVEADQKTFEIRRNDRMFQTGDLITLIRMKPDDSCKPDGDRCKHPRLTRRITYLFSPDPSLRDMGGIQTGYVVLGLGPVSV